MWLEQRHITYQETCMLLSGDAKWSCLCKLYSCWEVILLAFLLPTLSYKMETKLHVTLFSMKNFSLVILEEWSCQSQLFCLCCIMQHAHNFTRTSNWTTWKLHVLYSPQSSTLNPMHSSQCRKSYWINKRYSSIVCRIWACTVCMTLWRIHAHKLAGLVTCLLLSHVSIPFLWQKDPTGVWMSILISMLKIATEYPPVSLVLVAIFMTSHNWWKRNNI